VYATLTTEEMIDVIFFMDELVAGISQYLPVDAIVSAALDVNEWDRDVILVAIDASVGYTELEVRWPTPDDDGRDFAMAAVVRWGKRWQVG
jgi:hypothetical protein